MYNQPVMKVASKPKPVDIGFWRQLSTQDKEKFLNI